eukprot:TRINITY_DN51124_c0_g1_i1.p1 TRINITY_DN51124_c0_g1~~TRINITY_DN51124_c0_g1_i1.p1  ORF type:complete len:298 (+),score=53.79 TRINITY_DN51124_c0_g1_i1:63-956(+)
MAAAAAVAPAPGIAASIGSSLLELPSEILVGQLRACSALDLVMLSAAARLPSPKVPCAQGPEGEVELPLPAFVAWLALESQSWSWLGSRLPPPLLLRLFHFFRSERVTCGGCLVVPPVYGHLCETTSRGPSLVRCGTTRCGLRDMTGVEVALVAPANAWRAWPGAVDSAGCHLLPMPETFTLSANCELKNIAPVTRAGQLLAVVPFRWGYEGITAFPTEELALLQIARALNQRGECASVRKCKAKIHMLSLAQVRVSTRSSYQPLLADHLREFGDTVQTPLWAIVYTEDDPGFFCFS